MRHVLAATVLAACLWPAAAFATAGEQEFSAGVAGGVAAPGASAGVEGGWLYDLTDFWAIGAGLRDRRFFYDAPRGSTSLAADVRFAVDALTFIPALGASAGTVLTADGFKPFVRGEAALGYRPARSWGVEAAVGAEQESFTGAHLRWMFSLRLCWYRGAGIGLDL